MTDPPLVFVAVPGAHPLPLKGRVTKILKHMRELGLRCVCVRDPTWAELSAWCEEWFLVLSDAEVRELMRAREGGHG